MVILAENVPVYRAQQVNCHFSLMPSLTFSTLHLAASKTCGIVKLFSQQSQVLNLESLVTLPITDVVGFPTYSYLRPSLLNCIPISIIMIDTEPLS